MKHLTRHERQVRAVGCTMFDSSCDPVPSTSAGPGDVLTIDNDDDTASNTSTITLVR